ncbi:hypothetical protein DFJ77DRAFT_476145 [Powellomyces hirtus]|nr:hypothetical protein DFJ77DRAFT_476145 [Powellomyces hirtus]
MTLLTYLVPVVALLAQVAALPATSSAIHPRAPLAGQFTGDIGACPPLPMRTTVPTSVKDLRPDDFKAVMAIGDSITAAFAAEGMKLNPLENILENRGISFTMGGDKGAVTVANMLKRFSPKIVGASTGDRIVSLCSGRLCGIGGYFPQDRFNAALSGAKVENLDRELNYLIKTVKEDKTINYQKDWKFMSMLIGANDMCDVCDGTNLDGDTYERLIRAAFEKVRINLPNTVINVMSIFKVSEIWPLTKNELQCKIKRAVGLKALCGCAFVDGDTASGVAKRKVMDDYAAIWNQRLLKVVTEYRGKYDNFAVILDPAGGNTPLTQFDPSFVSNIDCFHPSERAHKYMARNLWNNLFLDSTNKTQKWPKDLDNNIYCPTATDRIQVA